MRACVVPAGSFRDPLPLLQAHEVILSVTLQGCAEGVLAFAATSHHGYLSLVRADGCVTATAPTPVVQRVSPCCTNSCGCRPASAAPLPTPDGMVTQMSVARPPPPLSASLAVFAHPAGRAAPGQGLCTALAVYSWVSQAQFAFLQDDVVLAGTATSELEVCWGTQRW
jgi:hypothetical protein